MVNNYLGDSLDLSILENIKEFSSKEITILCGAGISFDPPTSLPTVHSFTTRILEKFGADKHVIDSVSERIGKLKVFPRFELLIDDIRKDIDPELHIGNIFSSKLYNLTHLLLGKLILQGSNIVTTNFDTCIENSLRESKFNQYIFDGEDITTLDFKRSGGLYKPHGSVGLDNKGLVISVQALARTDRGFLNYPNWRELLLKLFSNKLVLVLGYSGSDDFDITPILLEAKPQQLIWLHYDQNSEIPQLMKKNETQSLPIYNTFSALPLKIYKGKLNWVVEQLLQYFSIQLKLHNSESQSDVFDYYVELIGNKETRRQEIINTVLNHYQLYDLVIKENQFGKSPLIDIQLIKSLYSSGKYQEVINFYDNAITPGHPHELIALYYYSSCLYYKGDLSESIKVAELLIDKLGNVDDPVFKINAHNHLGALYFSNDSPEKAEKNYQIALALNKSLSIDGYATSLWGLGDVNLTKEQSLEAINYYDQAKATYEKLGSLRGLAFVNLNLAESYIQMAEFDQAQEHLVQAESLYSELGHNVGLIYVYNAYIKVLYSLSDNKSCEQFLKKAKAMAKSNPAAPPAIYTYMLELLLNISSNQLSNDFNIFAKAIREEISIFEDGENRRFLLKQLESIDGNLGNLLEVKRSLEKFLLPTVKSE